MTTEVRWMRLSKRKRSVNVMEKEVLAISPKLGHVHAESQEAGEKDGAKR